MSCTDYCYVCLWQFYFINNHKSTLSTEMIHNVSFIYLMLVTQLTQLGSCYHPRCTSSCHYTWRECHLPWQLPVTDMSSQSQDKHVSFTETVTCETHVQLQIKKREVSFTETVICERHVLLQQRETCHLMRVTYERYVCVDITVFSLWLAQHSVTLWSK